MDNVIEIVALLRKHSAHELQILNGHGTAVAVLQDSKQQSGQGVGPAQPPKGGYRLRCRSDRARRRSSNSSVSGSTCNVR
jgi:hypothetical protein